MSDIVFYDTRTRSKQPFAPLEPDCVRMYTCGPTVYGPQHIGNLRSQLFPDLLRRFLEREGFAVRHVVNITDVGHLTDDADDGDDKMEMAAARAGRSAEEIAAHWTEHWRQNREAVNCRPPDVLCKATEHIPEQIELARTLEKGGHTYRLPDGIYFDVSTFPRYAELAHLDLEGQAGGHRIDEVAGKRHPADFALWKFAAEGVKRQQEWDSPWGRGFPGWHLECTAMSSRYLGETFDIHTGGIDLATVHHTNEVAQAECATGVHPWVQFWMHNEFLDFQGVKMSKSLGNVLTLDDLVAGGLPPLAFRYFFLQAHYRQQQTFTDEAIQAAATGHRRLCAAAAPLRDAKGVPDPERVAPYRDRFRAALCDDLNAPRALAVAWEVVRAEELTPADRYALIEDFDTVLGLDLLAEPEATPVETDPRIDALVAAREEARARKDFAEADRLRDQLAAEGIAVEDTPNGPRWRRT
ncbi:MAG: cysteine--tRNA ligase [Proteobacteria bacterium]|nr:cysteine--tRNA ligase [Pseudomonadota bacterium]